MRALASGPASRSALALAALLAAGAAAAPARQRRLLQRRPGVQLGRRPDRPLPARQLRPRPALRRGRGVADRRASTSRGDRADDRLLPGPRCSGSHRFLANAADHAVRLRVSASTSSTARARPAAQGALAPVARRSDSIYADVFGEPWLVLAIALAGMLGDVERAGAAPLHRDRRRARTVAGLSCLSRWPSSPSPHGRSAGLALDKPDVRRVPVDLRPRRHHAPRRARRARAADQLFDAARLRSPGSSLQFGGLEHCVRAGTGGEDSDPDVGPGPAALPSRRATRRSRSRRGRRRPPPTARSASTTPTSTPAHFLRYASGIGRARRRTTRRSTTATPDDAPRHRRDSSGYRLGVADKPAADAMEKGGQYQRLLLALVIFAGELGAFLLLGALSVGVILAQVVVLLLLAFSPVALVAAAIPGRGHDFFKAWRARSPTCCARPPTR